MNPAKLSRQLNEAAALHQGGDLMNAEKLYRQVLKAAPQQPDALHLLGVLLDQRGETEKGVKLVRQALGVQSAFPDAHFNLARMLADTDPAGAKTHYERTLALKPGHARAHNGLGVLYRTQRHYAEAYAAFERAARFEPRLLEAYINLCNTFRDSSNEAFIPATANQGLAVDPNCTELYLLRAEAFFTLGKLLEGWRDYEWRFSVRKTLLDVKPVTVPGYALPQWQGEDLTGKGILLWGEQGVGDEIIFASMVTAIAARAGRCVVQTTTRLVPLFKRSFPAIEVYAEAIPPDVVATLNVQSSLGSAGQWIRPSFRAFPATAAYLKADAARTAALRAKYRADGAQRLVVGLAWRSAHVADAADKTIGLEHWGPILKIPGVTFVNLQYGDTAEALKKASDAFGASIIEDPDIDALADLDGFASQVAAMDLVISTSNTAAHMAGALGVPTFCMVPRALGGGRRWYWFGEGQYAPWYRALRLFRQTQDSTWTDTIAAAGLALVECVIDAGPASSDLQNAYGIMLARAHRFGEAAIAYGRGIALSPDRAEIHNNLGTALRRAGRGTEAVAAYAQAHALKSDHPTIHLNYATSLADVGRLDEALQNLDRLIARQPDYVDAQYNRALVLMGLGRLMDGWTALAWRMRRPFVHVKHEDFPQPVWSGEPLAGKHVLVWTDHGLGDEILLGSMIPDAARTARHVTLLCSERLVGLFRRSFPGVTVDKRAAPLPAAALSKDIDFQMSIAELGANVRRDFAAFPTSGHSLKVDESLRTTLRHKYQQKAPGNILVGISWRSINPEIGMQKSLGLAAWLPILKVPGITFVNLQYGDCTAEIAQLQRDHGVNIIDDTAVDRLGDMDPVAAQVAAMDHVITISNTAAHLAGATGTSAWILVPDGHARLWYWFRGLVRSAWYPSAEVRAVEGGDWTKAVAQVADDLRLKTQAQT